MNQFDQIVYGIVAVLSAARLTRLLTFDKFPPVLWLRNKYEDATDGTSWQRLTLCPYCMSFWTTLAVLLWGYLADWNQPWFWANAVFAASYIAAIVQVHDGDKEDS